MEAITYIFGAYVLGFWIAFCIAIYEIWRQNLKDNPFVPALFSWIFVDFYFYFAIRSFVEKIIRK